MIDAVLRQFFVNTPLGDGAIVVAVSGGVDSTALLVALSELRESSRDLAAAHVNHHLRGEESDADEQFVRDLCSELKIPLHVADGTLDAALVSQRGIEAAAREIRYERLSMIRQSIGARYVATAHQKNDQAETVLMRLVAGGGIASLRGIHPLRGDGVIRPLLAVTRGEIERFLSEHDMVPRTDLSNSDPRFLRNRARIAVASLDAVEALASVASQMREAWPLLERCIDEADRSFALPAAEETVFNGWPANRWLRQALLQRHIRRLDPEGAREVSSRDLERLASEIEPTRRVSVTGSLELLAREGAAVLRRSAEAEPAPDFEVTLTPEAPAAVPGRRSIHLTRLAAVPPSLSRGDGLRQVIEVPDGRGVFTIRNRRRGDRFQPLGMHDSKKLKDFLIDRKIAVEKRAALPLLLWNAEIAWVAGVEVSERFKVTGRGGVLYEVWMEDGG